MTTPATHTAIATAWREMHEGLGKWPSVALLLLLVALPLAPGAVPLLLVLFIGATLVHHRRSIQRPGRQHWTTPLPWTALFFLWHVLAMAWTNDLDFGLFDLQIKAPLLVVPLLAMVLPVVPLPVRNSALFFHALAVALAVAVCIIMALVRIASGTGLAVSQEIFSSAFSLFLHPSYFALYLSFALATWVLTPIHARLKPVLSFTVLLLFCCGIVLCGSKLGWIALVLLLPFSLALRWQDRALRKTLLLLASASAVGLAVLIGGSPYARDRVEEAWRVAMQGEAADGAQTSSAVRTLTWSAAIALFREEPLLGTGTGDIKNELVRIYGERGQDWAQERRLNAHSQFLQTAACLGVMGLLALVMMVLAPFFGTSRRDPLVVVLCALCALNWSVESMLEVQAGVVWTALMFLMLFGRKPGGLA
jgi:O-antigen ligase